MDFGGINPLHVLCIERGCLLPTTVLFRLDKNWLGVGTHSRINAIAFCAAHSGPKERAGEELNAWSQP